MKRTFSFIAALLLLAGCSVNTEQSSDENCTLRFHENGEFKILQYTDTHWNGNNKDNPEVIKNVISRTIQKENPDFIIFTGDVVLHGEDIMKEWAVFADFMKSQGVPYAIVPGNHDPESADMKEVFAFLETQPMFIGEAGPEDIHGYGNTVLEVKASDGSHKTQALIYCLDSNDYSPSEEDYGYYAYFYSDQIDWYKSKSRSYTAANGGKPLPAVSFFHIPLPEYHDIPDSDRFGSFNERICSPDVNTGMYMAMREMGDMMGTFVGHDHSNDFIGNYHNIALAYGRRTQYDENVVPSGGRVIILKEGKRQFETYCTTPDETDYTFYYPSGYISTELTDYTFDPALDVAPTENGLTYSYLEGEFLSTDDIYTKGKVVKEGKINNFDITQAPVEDHFAYIFEGYVDIPETAVYTFFLNSDDGAKLYLDGKLLVNNDGSHSAERKGTRLGLEKGFHEIKVEYFEDYMGQELKVRMMSINYPLSSFDDNMLYIK